MSDEPAKTVGVVVPSQDELPEGVTPAEAIAGALMEKSELELLVIARKALMVNLTVKMALGTATHQEMAVLRNMLKDNGLILDLPTKPDPDDLHDCRLPDIEDVPHLEDPAE